MKLKRIEYTCLLIGLYIALETSYIHPDEHFQTIEPLVLQHTGIKGTLPWEFWPENASRSWTTLRLFFLPLLWLNKNLFHLPPIGLLYLYRLQNYIIYHITVNIFLEFCEVSVTNRTKAKFFIRTSYITWGFQTHTFSNSVETILILLTLLICQLFLYGSRNRSYNSTMSGHWLGALISLGIFNRVTFPAFLIFPLLSVVYHCFKSSWKSFIIAGLSALFYSGLIIFFDTLAFGNNSSLVIAPLNNLLYNMDESNLSSHGLHHRWMHILVNVPMICGPLLLFFVSKRLALKLPTLACISGIFFLSFIKHQELRFLTPILPLLSVSVNLANFDSYLNAEIVIKCWLVFNIILGSIYGIFHQGGIIPLISNHSGKEIPIHIWWKTYSPPTWIYNNYNLTVSTTNFEKNEEKIDNIEWNVVKNHIVDLKGCNISLLNSTLNNFLGHTESVMLILPNSVNSRLRELESQWNFSKVWETKKHIDFDHFDLPNLDTITPGLSMYSVKRLL